MSDEEETIASIPPPDTGEIEFGSELPVLPIRNAVLFPAAVAPFDVGREKSVALVEDIENLDQPIIAILAQRDPSTDDPDQSDLYPVGVAARVLKALKHSSGNYSLILQGLVRIRLEQVVTAPPPDTTIRAAFRFTFCSSTCRSINLMARQVSSNSTASSIT